MMAALFQAAHQSDQNATLKSASLSHNRERAPYYREIVQLISTHSDGQYLVPAER
jgi:hypothetical protein